MRGWIIPDTIKPTKLEGFQKMKIKQALAVLPFSLLYISAASALPDTNASTVSLKTDCGTDTACFADSNSLLDWIWNTRLPSAASPLLVNIGPGTFSPINCSGQGHVTFRGAGREATTISGFIGASFSACQNISVENLSVRGSLAGVTWFGGGSSNWVNVHMIANYAAWYDAIGNSGSPCVNGNQGRHTYFGSTLEVTNATFGPAHTFFNACGSNWLYGSEVIMKVTSGGTSADVGAVFSHGAGNEVHLYGSNVHVVTDSNAPSGSPDALVASDNGAIHSHGTGIDVISENASAISAIKVSSGGLVHASESAYVLKTGVGGTITRIINNGGTVNAPHQWGENANPPGISSVTGADTAVITNTSDNQPHMVISSNSCTSGWYDMVTAGCI